MDFEIFLLGLASGMLIKVITDSIINHGLKVAKVDIDKTSEGIEQ